MKSALSLVILTSLFCGNLVYATSDLNAVQQGTVNITVMDENGNVVQDAPVYIYGQQKSQFLGGKDVPGTTTLTMKEGDYRFSSAMIKKTGDDIDRYASNEAQVQVIAGDNVSVILTLRPIQTEDQEVQSYDTLHVAGVPGSLLNNN